MTNSYESHPSGVSHEMYPFIKRLLSEGKRFNEVTREVAKKFSISGKSAGYKVWLVNRDLEGRPVGRDRGTHKVVGTSLKTILEESKSGAAIEVFSGKESNLYPHVIDALKKNIQGKNVHLEITATGGKFSKEMNKSLDNAAFYFVKSERQSPDIMGYVIEDESPFGFGISAHQAQNHIVVEVKNESISIADIYQTKRYGEVFDAKYAFLISTEPIAEEIRRFIAERPSVLQYQYSNGIREIVFGELDPKSDNLHFEDFG